ncbi:hypothetical protein EDI_287490 [Entamoeba dispar SAW760]|uniref:Uncharacterized protein n=1 Tax=Entamoeba dispar (strain ATCC PRA-260 / SAW760) TaxID=370354 RepID=B0E8M9_ENTDS|nr:uncharacterized protein EDI_287490 [Entamoeba dispar SAW760]EDR29119.1 hypothetical protein EDI_287490 [Entamoeba dispar SAW760]|eukprot:EDR29119.1 hypothetical protein EDI_287490 [Entamoeba dispar SAW760]
MSKQKITKIFIKNKNEVKSNVFDSDETEENEHPRENVFEEEERMLREEGNYIESDDDEWYDQTKKEDEVEELSSFEDSIKRLIDVQFEIYVMEEEQKEMEEEIDELDQFMKMNEHQLKHEKGVDELKEIERKLIEVINKVKPSNKTWDEINSNINKQLKIKKLVRGCVGIKRKPNEPVLETKRKVEEDKVSDVKPKLDQKGDGKSRLNELYGY